VAGRVAHPAAACQNIIQNIFKKIDRRRTTRFTRSKNVMMRLRDVLIVESGKAYTFQRFQNDKKSQLVDIQSINEAGTNYA